MDVVMRPILVVNPRSDPSFAGLAESLASDGVAGPQDLEARLRGDYPSAVVRARDLSGEERTVWYVYRDGHWVSSEGT
jgi:hypothetical protein